MSTLAPSHATQDMFTEVSGIVHKFVEEWDPSFYREYEQNDSLEEKDMENVPQTAALLQICKEKHAQRTPALLETRPANHFDQAVARAVMQELVDGFWSEPSDMGLVIGLVELIYKTLYSASIPRPGGTLSLETLICEAEAKLLDVRTRLIGWLREYEGLEEGERKQRLKEPEKWTTVSVDMVIMTSMSLLYIRLRRSRCWARSGDLKSLSRFAFRVACDNMQLDKDPMLPEYWRKLLMHGVLIWLGTSDDFFLVELLKDAAMGQRQICFWRDRFNDFFEQFPGAFDAELKYNDELEKVRFWAEVVDHRHSGASATGDLIEQATLRP